MLKLWTTALLRNHFHRCFISPHQVVAQCHYFLLLWFKILLFHRRLSVICLQIHTFTGLTCLRLDMAITRQKKKSPLGSLWLKQIVNNVSKNFALPAWCTVNYASKGLNSRNDIIWFRVSSSCLSPAPIQYHPLKAAQSLTGVALIGVSKLVQSGFSLNVRVTRMRDWRSSDSSDSPGAFFSVSLFTEPALTKHDQALEQCCELCPSWWVNEPLIQT